MIQHKTVLWVACSGTENVKIFYKKFFAWGKFLQGGWVLVEQTWLDGPNVKKLVFV
jgi:hypothetical protein